MLSFTHHTWTAAIASAAPAGIRQLLGHHARAAAQEPNRKFRGSACTRGNSAAAAAAAEDHLKAAGLLEAVFKPEQLMHPMHGMRADTNEHRLGEQW